MSKRNRLSVQISDKLAKALENQAKRQEVKTSEVVRQILEQFFELSDNKTKVSDKVERLSDNVATKPKKAKPVQSGKAWKPYGKKQAAK